MSHWLTERIHCITIRLDAGHSRLLCSRHCRCRREPAAPSPADAPDSTAPRTFRKILEGASEWTAIVRRIMQALAPFPDATRAVFAVLEPADAPG